MKAANENQRQPHQLNGAISLIMKLVAKAISRSIGWLAAIDIHLWLINRQSMK
jgi:hypothetical protein